MCLRGEYATLVTTAKEHQAISILNEQGIGTRRELIATGSEVAPIRAILRTPERRQEVTIRINTSENLGTLGTGRRQRYQHGIARNREA